MKLNIQKANATLLAEYYGKVSELGLEKLSLQSKSNAFLEAFDHLPVMYEWLEQRLEISSRFVEGLRRDRDEMYDEEAGHTAFHLAMEFFWQLERISLEVMPSILVDEPQRIEVPSAELFNLWQSKFTGLDGLIPARNCPNMLSLGQSHSVSGFRRISKLLDSQKSFLQNIEIGSLDYPLDEFKPGAEGVLSHAFLRTTGLDSIYDQFEEFQDQCRHILGVIIDMAEQMNSQTSLVFWLLDDELSDRALENFVLDETPVDAALEN